MSRIDYTWMIGAPHKPDVYVTRINESRIRSVRYWDGERWFDIGVSRARRGDPQKAAGKPFKWPKGARVKRPYWFSFYPAQSIVLRNITNQAAIQWGTPFRVYDEKEVLAHLVSTGVLPAGWRTVYQDEMRARDNREIRE